MNRYKVTIVETLTKAVIVEAEDRTDALDKVYDAIESEDIALTMDDYKQDSRVVYVSKAKGHDFYLYDNLEDIDEYDELTNDYTQW